MGDATIDLLKQVQMHGEVLENLTTKLANAQVKEESNSIPPLRFCWSERFEKLNALPSKPQCGLDMCPLGIFSISGCTCLFAARLGCPEGHMGNLIAVSLFYFNDPCCWGCHDRNGKVQCTSCSTAKWSALTQLQVK